MQTVASLAERLDMSAEEAVDKLRFMLHLSISLMLNPSDQIKYAIVLFQIWAE